MNRQVLFRGKQKDDGKWLQGFYAIQSNHACYQSELKYTSFILKDEFMDWGLGGLAEYEVIPESVGQFTGLTDKNGNKIFEGDIVKCLSLENGYVNKEVYYAEDRARFVLGSLGSDYDFEEYINVEVIGNIYDNPELLHNGD